MRSTWRFNFPSPSEKKNHSYIRNEFVTENEYGKKDKTQTNPVYFGCFYSSFFQMRQRIPPIVEPVYSLTWHLVAPENRRPVSTYPGKRKKKGILVFNYCKTKGREKKKLHTSESPLDKNWGNASRTLSSITSEQYLWKSESAISIFFQTDSKFLLIFLLKVSIKHQYLCIQLHQTSESQLLS